MRAALKQRGAVVGGAIVVVFAAVALLAPVIAPYGVDQSFGEIFGHPSLSHPFGLDDSTHDVLTRVMWGGRTSLSIGLAATAIAVLLGTTVGVLAGYSRGLVDHALMRITDYVLVLPSIPLVIVVIATWGPSVSHLAIVIGLLLWTTTARLVRAQVKSMRELVYVRRAVSLGAGDLRIVTRYILPQVTPLVLASGVLTLAHAIFVEAALAFLGLGDPGSVSWGTMIEAAFQRTAVSAGAWWTIVAPGTCIAVFILACSLLSRASEEALNPRLRVAYLSARGPRIVPQ
jgi:peptide/nickel transport system permease protein